MSELAVIPINPNNLNVLVEILSPYSVYVKKREAPSCQRGMKLLTIESLRQRLSALAASSDQQTHLFSAAELHIIDQALLLFISALPHITAKNRDAHSTLAACKKLRAYLLTHQTP